MNQRTLGEEGVIPEDLAAYQANYGAYKIGISTRDCVAHYNEVVGMYEQNLSPSRYNGPVYAAQTAQKYVKAGPDVRILDVAAGTGFVGEKLNRRGFTNLDALDPAALMLKVAEQKDIYKRLICSVLAEDKTDIEDDTYDCLLVSGGMGEGHIPCRALTEMIRIVRPGGLVIIVMREEYLGYVEEYVDRLEPFMAELETRGKWKREERTVVPNYAFEKNGVIFVWRVLEQGMTSFLSSVL